VHLRNVDGARGAKLFAALHTLLHPNEWHASSLFESQLSYKALILRVDQNAAVTMKDVYTVNDYPHPSTEPMQAYARAVLHRTAAAVRGCRDAPHACCTAAANDLEASRSFAHVIGLLYPSSSTLADHEDNCGSYVVLLSIGCTVDFFVDGKVIQLASGDAIIFHGGVAHQVRHGVRGVRTGTCPPELPPELHDKRLSVLMVQQ
jgi:hypothetical protein